MDIEGTTTSISFVSDVLFPYAKKELRSFLERTWECEETQQDVEALRRLAISDIAESQGQNSQHEVVLIPEWKVGDDESSKKKTIDAVEANVAAQMSIDRKSTPLKQLQGHIWKCGFESKELEGELYEDVLTCWKRWKDQLGLQLFIYSSGSISAQKLLFGHNKYGNLLPYITDHFDTTIGSKIEAESYKKIFEKIISSSDYQSNPIDISDVLFATDNIKEAIAAKGAGMSVVISIRPGTAALPENHGFVTAHSFLEFDQYYNIGE